MADIISLITQYPRVSIIVIAIVISFFITVINYFFIDQNRMREIKTRQKVLQKEMKEHQKAGNTDKLMELQKELFSYTGEMFKHSMKPMLITIVPILVLFAFIKNVYAGTALAKTWFWYYLISAIVGSIIFRKVFRLP